MLISGNDSVGRDMFALWTPITPSDTPTQVNITWYYLNNVVGWNTTDEGPATFYSCTEGVSLDLQTQILKAKLPACLARLCQRPGLSRRYSEQTTSVSTQVSVSTQATVSTVVSQSTAVVQSTVTAPASTTQRVHLLAQPHSKHRIRLQLRRIAGWNKLDNRTPTATSIVQYHDFARIFRRSRGCYYDCCPTCLDHCCPACLNHHPC